MSVYLCVHEKDMRLSEEMAGAHCSNMMAQMLFMLEKKGAFWGEGENITQHNLGKILLSFIYFTFMYNWEECRSGNNKPKR